MSINNESFINLTCHNCGAPIDPSLLKDIYTCPYCRTKYILVENKLQKYIPPPKIEDDKDDKYDIDDNYSSNTTSWNSLTPIFMIIYIIVAFLIASLLFPIAMQQITKNLTTSNTSFNTGITTTFQTMGLIIPILIVIIIVSKFLGAF